jgi:hypothetical protein
MQVRKDHRVVTGVFAFYWDVCYGMMTSATECTLVTMVVTGRLTERPSVLMAHYFRLGCYTDPWLSERDMRRSTIPARYRGRTNP